jgi:hypothetical protein
VEQALWIGGHAVVERAARRIAGGAGPGSYEVRFDRHRELGGAWFPFRVRLESAPAHVKLDLTWSEVEVNGAPAPELFRLEPPRGARVVDVGAGGEG